LFFGIEVVQNSQRILICQRKYTCEILARFDMENSNVVKNPNAAGTKLSKEDVGTKFIQPCLGK